jgi:hypothetical protein
MANVNSENRRKFLKSGLRSMMLGGIAVVTGILGWREISASDEDNLCVIDLPCRDCSKISGCVYPEAEEQRKITQAK